MKEKPCYSCLAFGLLKRVKNGSKRIRKQGRGVCTNNLESDVEKMKIGGQRGFSLQQHRPVCECLCVLLQTLSSKCLFAVTFQDFDVHCED